MKKDKSTMLINGDGSLTTFATSLSSGISSCTTFGGPMWSSPVLVETNVLSDSIELVYVRHSMASINWGESARQVYKIIYSCQEGKWHVSEPIIGEIIPAQKEEYEFNGQPV